MTADPLPPYRKSVRPTLPESFPRYAEEELLKIERAMAFQRSVILQQQAAITQLQADVAALSTP